MEKVISYFSVYSVLLPILLGTTTLTKKNRLALVILMLCLVSFLADTAAPLYARRWGNNYIVSHIYHLCEFFLLGYFYSAYTKKKAIGFLVYGFAAYYLFTILIDSGHLKFDPLILGIRCLLFIGLSVYGFMLMFRREDHLFIEENVVFWFNTGLLVYFSGAFFSWIMVRVILNPDHSLTWAFHNLANGLKNIIFAIGFWQIIKRP